MKLPLRGATLVEDHSDESTSLAITSLDIAGGVPNSSITDDMCSGHAIPYTRLWGLPKPRGVRLQVDGIPRHAST
jgi:hypothetical protein